MSPMTTALTRQGPAALGAVSGTRPCRSLAPLVVKPSAGVRAPRRIATVRAAESESQTDVQEQIKEQVTEITGKIKDTWAGTDDKAAVVAIGVAAFVGLWALNGVAGSLEKLPLVGGLLELVGIFVTAWFIYRYLVFGPDREELKNNINDFVKKVLGSK
ncbi:hypothetical protein BSKO_06255 [Bryopsis sp. KO-2023]|nr:hypothetical protein BSKO_06255 [Bryopsis sp. KO-2023]